MPTSVIGLGGARSSVSRWIGDEVTGAVYRDPLDSERQQRDSQKQTIYRYTPTTILRQLRVDDRPVTDRQELSNLGEIRMIPVKIQLFQKD